MLRTRQPESSFLLAAFTFAQDEKGDHERPFGYAWLQCDVGIDGSHV